MAAVGSRFYILSNLTIQTLHLYVKSCTYIRCNKKRNFNDLTLICKYMIKQNVIQFHCVSFPSQVASLAVSFQKLFLWIKRVQLLVLNVCTYFLSNQYEAVVFF